MADEKNPKTPNYSAWSIKFGVISHTIVLLILLTALAMIMMALLASSTLSAKTATGQLSNALWLIELRSGESSAEYTDQDIWGLGPVSICRWNNDVDKLLRKGECIRKIGWSFLRDVSEEQRGVIKEVPNALQGAVSIISFFLIFAVPLLLAYWIYLLISYLKPVKYRYSKSQKTITIVPYASDKGEYEKRLKRYQAQRSWTVGGVWSAVQVISMLIVLMVVITLEVAIGQVKNMEGAQLSLKLGTAGMMLIGALVLMSIADLMVHVAGLRVKNGDRT